MSVLCPRGLRRLALAAAFVLLAGCHRATFQENYTAGLDELRKGNVERARERLFRAYRQNPNSLDLKYYLADVSLKLNDFQGAYALLSQAEAQDKEGAGIGIAVRLSLARIFIVAKQYDEAQKRLLWVLDKQPHNHDARALLAANLSYLAQPDAAREQVDLLLTEDPKDPSGRVLDVALHLGDRDTKHAETSLLEEVKVSNRSIDSLASLSFFYRLRQTPDKAIPLLQECIQRDPKNLAWREQLGWTYQQTENRVKAVETFRGMAALSNDRRAQMALANYFINMSDWNAAIAELERLRTRFPDVVTRNLLAASYYRSGRWAEAEALARQLISENDHNREAHMLLGALHLGHRDYDEAAQQFNHVLHDAPDSATALYFLAMASYGAGKEALALQQMEKALDLRKDLLPARIWLIDHHLKRGSNGVALELVRGAPGRQAYAPEIILYRDLCDPLAGLSAEQIAALRRALLLRPRFISEYENLGMFTLLRKYGGDLERPLDTVAQKHPELRSVQQLLMRILEAQGKQQQEIAMLERRIALQPNSVPNLLAVAHLLISQGKKKDARDELDKAARLEPYNPGVLARFAELEVSEGNLVAATDRLDQLIRRYPDFSEGYTFKAIVLEQRKQPKDARSLYEQALKYDSHDAVAANNLAWLMATTFEEPESALELARRAHRLAPANAEFCDTLGWIQFQLGRFDDSMESLGDAVRLQPDDAHVRYHLGMVQSRAGRNKEAVATLKAALLLDPKLPEAAQVREELVGLNTRLTRVDH